CIKCHVNDAHYSTPKAKKASYCKDCCEEMKFKKDDKVLSEVVEKKSFPHQITINYAYKEGMNINMFLFRKNIKISGFQSEKYTIRMIKKFWKNHLVKITSGITYLTN